MERWEDKASLLTSEAGPSSGRAGLQKGGTSEGRSLRRAELELGKNNASEGRCFGRAELLSD